MTDRFCVIPGCRELNAHLDDCDSDRCKGCQPRAVESGFVCTSDRIKLAGDLAEIGALWPQLNEELDPVDHTGWMWCPVPTSDPARLPPWCWWRDKGDDVLARVLPMGIVRHGNQGKVSGSKEPAAPTNLDMLDLAAEARNTNLTAAGREYLADQIGHPAVAAVLDSWVRDWRDTLWPDQRLPIPTVPTLVTWLSNRLSDACDRHPAIDDFADEIGDLRRTLRGVLQLTDAPRERIEGVECKSCDRMALYRESGLVSCGYCALNYSEREYREWVGLLAGQARRMVA